MTQVTPHPRFIYQYFVSLRKFESSMKRVMETTLKNVNFDPATSLTPTYIAINVGYEPNHDLLKTIRSFFHMLRKTHCQYFVRFVTDTMWAMESDNGDIFYTCDEDKDRRADVIWSLKVCDRDQFELRIERPEDNIRREILTNLQASLDRSFKVNTKDPLVLQLRDVTANFFRNTKNIKSLMQLDEPCQVLLVETDIKNLYRPVLVCGISPTDAKRRYQMIEKQLDHQQHNWYEYFTKRATLPEVLSAPLETLYQNGISTDKGFSARVQYDAAEQAYAIYRANRRADDNSLHDVIAMKAIKLPTAMVSTNQYSFEYLSSVV